MECEMCDSDDTMLLKGDYYPEDDYQEPDAVECFDCGHVEVL